MSTQPDLLPAPAEQLVSVPASQADAAAARVRALGGAILWFRPKAPDKIEMNIILDATLLAEAMEAQPT